MEGSSSRQFSCKSIITLEVKGPVEVHKLWWFDSIKVKSRKENLQFGFRTHPLSQYAMRLEAGSHRYNCAVFLKLSSRLPHSPPFWPLTLRSQVSLSMRTNTRSEAMSLSIDWGPSPCRSCCMQLSASVVFLKILTLQHGQLCHCYFKVKNPRFTRLGIAHPSHSQKAAFLSWEALSVSRITQEATQHSQVTAFRYRGSHLKSPDIAFSSLSLLVSFLPVASVKLSVQFSGPSAP